jgi:GAF domain-containing protein
MKRRSRAGRQPIKGRRQKTPEPERGNVRKAVRSRSSTAGKETKVARLTRERDEALEQQTATSEVLQIISGLAGDPQPVFETILAKAVRICDAHFGNIHRWDGNAFYLVGAHNTPPALAEARRRSPLLASPQTAPGRLVATKTAVHITDLAADSNYIEARDPTYVTGVELGGVRTLLIVPMLRESELVGSFAVYRQEVRPFTDKQIALVTNFAAQAVIAIENARLLNELRESLQQQTATADVLKIISRSTFDLRKVLDTLLESAARLCDADRAAITQPKDDVLEFAASFGFPPEFTEVMSKVKFVPGKGTVTGRVLLEGKYVQIDDVLADPEYSLLEQQSVGKYRTVLCVPLMREGIPVGVITLTRNVVKRFTEKQVELVSTFADQAVIAIENARLLNELRGRTADLTESLKQQTATADVLKVISRSTFELQAVLDTLVESAAHLCEADIASILRPDGSAFQLIANYRQPQSFVDFAANKPIPGGRGSLTGRVMASGQVVHIPDVQIDPEYTYSEAQKTVTFRSGLGAPLIREGTPIGVIVLWRSRVRPFTDKQIELVTTFADQAMIAIENARLVDELRHRTDELGRSVGELRALGEVSQAVNSTLDLETVLSTIVAKAVQLSDTEAGAI